MSRVKVAALYQSRAEDNGFAPRTAPCYVFQLSLEDPAVALPRVRYRHQQRSENFAVQWPAACIRTRIKAAMRRLIGILIVALIAIAAYKLLA